MRLHSGCFVASSRWMFLWRLHSGWFSDGGPAVQPPGLSYKAHWEVLGCALCLLTTTAISRTGPVWNRAFAPAPAALVFLLDHVLFPSYMYVSPMYLCSCSTIWFLFCKTEIRIGTGKKPRVCVCDSRRPRARVPLVVWAWDLVCYPASLLWSPGPRPSPVFRSAICDCLSLNVPIPLCLSCGGSCSSCVVGGCAWRSCVRRLPAVVVSAPHLRPKSWSVVPPLRFSFCAFVGFLGFVGLAYEVIQYTYLSLL